MQHKSRGLKKLWKCKKEQRSFQDTVELHGHYSLQETELFVKEEAKRKAEAALLTWDCSGEYKAKWG